MVNCKLKIAIILGTRPEIIKMCPIIRECITRKLDFFVLHTNQHYSKNLDGVFFEELDLPKPKYNLGIGSGSHIQEISRMITGMETIFLKEKPDLVLVEGDTNTVLAGALSASKLNIKIGHIEAGLRSFFKEMPEEVNRILTDHCSDFLFTPTKKSRSNLIKEGISKKDIFVTGNTVVDAVFQNFKLSEQKSKILEKFNLDKQNFFLLTIHRQENADNKIRLESILKGLDLVYKKFGMPIVFPIHPRTGKMLKRFKLNVPEGVRAIDPVGYLDFLKLESSAKLIITDSGGVQEEACILKVPCVTVRDNTERPETVEIKSNILSGVDPSNILENVEKMLYINIKWKNPFGKKGVAKKIVDICAYV